MCPHNDSSDIICRSKLKRGFIGSTNWSEGRRDGRSGLILRSVDLHTTTTLFFLFKKVRVSGVHVRDYFYLVNKNIRFNYIYMYIIGELKPLDDPTAASKSSDVVG